uniref:FHA domain-containing protein n=1 Tax=Chromera velia CCMP2878 TaxID=1169474 RepID=A0A0G4GK48_9ALVE|eukprot:Cvel_22259.t1-p1 / transcript=Cvel_22259.t1 / gene=Cvel_22259 / organism=Chromera_velia_CCMP2878 / gene_product=hypothetical protein / transcript_product=hypothetical protein / location=Cvel_scaffold2170:12774-17888(-) / protein_length=1179 / sequence_SO=supercontig / SO=protein_coding / is_pseudo=false
MSWKVHCKHSGDVYTLTSGTFTLGRQNCDIELQDRSVSRHHACLEIEPVQQLKFAEVPTQNFFVKDSVTQHPDREPLPFHRPIPRIRDAATPTHPSQHPHRVVIDGRPLQQHRQTKDGKVELGKDVEFSLGNAREQFVLEFEPLIFVVTGLTSNGTESDSVRSALLERARKAGAYLSFETSWPQDAFALLVAGKKLTVNQKILACMMKGRPIVTPDYLDDLAKKRIWTARGLPNTLVRAPSGVSSFPHLLEYLRAPQSRPRGSLFLYRTFLFIDKHLYDHFNSALMAGGGTRVSLVGQSGESLVSRLISRLQSVVLVLAKQHARLNRIAATQTQTQGAGLEGAPLTAPPPPTLLPVYLIDPSIQKERDKEKGGQGSSSSSSSASQSSPQRMAVRQALEKAVRGDVGGKGGNAKASGGPLVVSARQNGFPLEGIVLREITVSHLGQSVIQGRLETASASDGQASEGKDGGGRRKEKKSAAEEKEKASQVFQCIDDVTPITFLARAPQAALPPPPASARGSPREAPPPANPSNQRATEENRLQVKEGGGQKKRNMPTENATSAREQPTEAVRPAGKRKTEAPAPRPAPLTRARKSNAPPRLFDDDDEDEAEAEAASSSPTKPTAPSPSADLQTRSAIQVDSAAVSASASSHVSPERRHRDTQRGAEALQIKVSQVEDKKGKRGAVRERDSAECVKRQRVEGLGKEDREREEVQEPEEAASDAPRTRSNGDRGRVQELAGPLEIAYGKKQSAKGKEAERGRNGDVERSKRPCPPSPSPPPVEEQKGGDEGEGSLLKRRKGQVSPQPSSGAGAVPARSLPPSPSGATAASCSAAQQSVSVSREGGEEGASRASMATAEQRQRQKERERSRERKGREVDRGQTGITGGVARSHLSEKKPEQPKEREDSASSRDNIGGERGTEREGGRGGGRRPSPSPSPEGRGLGREPAEDGRNPRALLDRAKVREERKEWAAADLQAWRAAIEMRGGNEGQDEGWVRRLDPGTRSRRRVEGAEGLGPSEGRSGPGPEEMELLGPVPEAAGVLRLPRSQLCVETGEGTERRQTARGRGTEDAGDEADWRDGSGGGGQGGGTNGGKVFIKVRQFCTGGGSVQSWGQLPASVRREVEAKRSALHTQGAWSEDRDKRVVSFFLQKHAKSFTQEIGLKVYDEKKRAPGGWEGAEEEES